MLRFEKKKETGEQIRLAGLSPLLAKLLWERGVRNEEEAEAFLYPCLSSLSEPLSMKDMEKARDRILRALENGEKICVYGDYDVDGVCSSAILFRYLRSVGASVFCFLPSRHEEGYGMHMGAVEKLAKEGVSLIITVDNGIKAHKEIQYAYSLGMEVVVTDHHIVDGELPDCEAVVCHTRPDNGRAGAGLCGAGTAFKLVWALGGPEAAREYIPLAGIATVADIMPLLGENRVLVAECIKMIREDSCQVGIKALKKRAVSKGRFTAYSIGFGLGPRLNAAGRLGEATEALELLCTDDPREAEALADILEKRNQERKDEEKRICDEVFSYLEAQDLTEKSSIVLKGDWNPGVTGLAAGRAAERYMRPTILLSETEGELRGSARSVGGVDLYSAVLSCRDLLLRFGGHEAAAGLSLLPENFTALQDAFDAAVARIAPENAFVPKAQYELSGDIGSFSLELARDLERLAPFGEGNPQPTFRCDETALLRLRSVGDGRTLQAVAAKEGAYLESVMFNMGERFQEFLDMERADLLCTPTVNEFRGQEKLQLQISRIRPCPPRDAAAYVERHSSKFADAFLTNILYNSMDSQKIRAVDPKLWMRENMEERERGSLLICFSPEGAAYYLRELSKEAEKEAGISPLFHSLPRHPTAYNSVLFAPKLTEGLSIERFRRILLLDEAPSRGIVERIRSLAPLGEILWGGIAGNKELLCHFPLDRKCMGDCFRALKNSIRPLYNREEAADLLSEKTGQERSLSALCLQVMEELDFLERDKNGAYRLRPSLPKRDLMESPSYRTIASLREREQETGGSHGS